MHMVFDFIVLRFDFGYILFIHLFIYFFIYFDIYTHVACIKFVMLFLVKLNGARDFRLELFFIWHHKSNTLIDLRTFINRLMHNKCIFAETLVIFLVISIFSLFLAGSPGFFNQKIKYLQISIFLCWQVCQWPDQVHPDFWTLWCCLQL